MTVTKEKGDWYANYPKQDRYVDQAGETRGTLHVGGGLDTPFSPSKVHRPPFMKNIYNDVRKMTGEIIPGTKNQPPVAAWSGVMAFTEDRGPILSFLYRKDGTIDKAVVLASTCNGYGGSQCVISGELAGKMSQTGEISDSTPDDIFSMRRFMSDKPLFLEPSSERCAPFFRHPSPL